MTGDIATRPICSPHRSVGLEDSLAFVAGFGKDLAILCKPSHSYNR